MIDSTIDFFRTVIERGAEAFACGVVGFGLGFVIAFGGRGALRRIPGPWRNKGDETPRLREALHARDAEICELKEAVDAAETRAADADELSRSYEALKEDCDAERTELHAEIDRLGDQLGSIVDEQGREWEKPVVGTVPRFVPRRDRRANVVAVVNLKGGVGKTTLTANLGATLADLGQRTLVVDLDHQHSLSDLCFPEWRRQDLAATGRLLERGFESADPAATFAASVERVGDGSLFAVACGEELAEAESRSKARWISGQAVADVRYVLREAVHAGPVAGEFDWVLLDCPPRLTTAAINGLAAADEVLVPVILDATSANGVPRLFQWLSRLKYDARVCPEIDVLGVVANQTYRAGSLTIREQQTWNDLIGKSSDRWDRPVHFFETAVPRKSCVADAAAANRIAAFDDGLRATFLDLATEVRGKVTTG